MPIKQKRKLVALNQPIKMLTNKAIVDIRLRRHCAITPPKVYILP